MDLDDDAANDWQTTVTVDGLTWTAPSGADALDWGMMFRFSFDAEGIPEIAKADLVPLEAGSTIVERITTLVPSASTALIFADGFESGNTSAWSLTQP